MGMTLGFNSVDAIKAPDCIEVVTGKIPMYSEPRSRCVWTLEFKLLNPSETGAASAR
jgi:hypothetical protein